MGEIILKLLDVNYGEMFFIFILAILSYEWIKLIIVKIFKFIFKDHNSFKEYNSLSEIDLKIAENLIKNMTGREFEKFCAWLFKKSGKYESVELTKASCDGGKDIILNGDTYVECKRYNDGNGEYDTFEIGREICQKLVGAMVGDGIKKGIIVTTGSINKNAWEYLKNIEKNTDLQLEFIIFSELINMIREINSDEIFNEIINIKDETDLAVN